jgi:hypothetical protein
VPAIIAETARGRNATGMC